MDEKRKHRGGPENPGRPDEMDDLAARLRDSYNAPPETPREEMWAIVEASLEARRGAGASSGAKVIPLETIRARRTPAVHRGLGWGVAAAALLILGVGIGRMSLRTPAPTAGAVDVPDPTALHVAALEHLGQTESLLTVVRADARSGRLDPQVGPWARSLLAETRLLLDAPDERDPAMKELLQDLELVLVQIVGVTDNGGHNAARTRTELNLTLQGLKDRDLLPRIQAMVPVGSGLLGAD